MHLVIALGSSLGLGFASCAALASVGVAGQLDAQPTAARDVLGRAFENRYEVNTISAVELVIRNRSGQERRRRFRTVSKIIDGRLHSIGRLVWPEHLNGMTVMIIEVDERSHDSFVYLPSLGKVRRVTTAQRGDAFLGSDLTYEDFERQRISDYELRFLDPGMVGGEPVHVIRGRPRHKLSYQNVDFLIATRDNAILETRYFKRGTTEPYRVIVVPRESMTNGRGHVLPRRIVVHNLIRGTSTEVIFHELEIDPSIDDRIFSVRTLEQRRRLPPPAD